MYVSYSTAFNK